MFFSFFRLLTMVLLLASASLHPLTAQERNAGTVPAASANTGQQKFSGNLMSSVSTTAALMNNSCTVGGTTYTHGQSWSTSCPVGSTGPANGLTYTCLNGQAVIQSQNCKFAQPCNVNGTSYPSGSSFSGACPSGTTGTMTYQCQDGNVVVPTGSSNYNSCKATNCSGATGTVACPASVGSSPAIAMTGTLSYTCDKNNFTITNSSCATVNRPCGTILSGTDHSAWCYSYDPSLGGTVSMHCNNSQDSVTALNCNYASWHSFSLSIGSCTDPNNDGNRNPQCTISANLRTLVTNKYGIAPNAPIRNAKVQANFWNGTWSPAMGVDLTNGTAGKYNNGSNYWEGCDNGFSVYRGAVLSFSGSTLSANAWVAIGSSNWQCTTYGWFPAKVTSLTYTGEVFY